MEQEERILKLTEVLKDAKELSAQNRSLRPEDLDKVREVWEEQEAILKEAVRNGNQSVQEMILDLQIMYSTTYYIGQHIRELQTTVKHFNPVDYAEKLFSKFSQNGEMEWQKLSNDAIRIINRAPGVPLLLGTFGSNNITKKIDEKKKAAPRVSKIKEAVAEKQTAKKVENLTEDKDSVDIKVARILEVLQQLYRENENQPISFYRFILHPIKFTTTVENIFYISFVIRDGLARLDIDETDELVISPLQKQGKKEKQETKNQMVFSITMDEWRNLVSSYSISEPLLKF